MVSEGWYPVVEGAAIGSGEVTGTASFAVLIETPGPDETAPLMSQASPGPTGESLPCAVLIDPTSLVVPPTLLMGATPGDSIAYAGVIGTWTLGGPEVLEPDEWMRPEPAAAPTIQAGPTGGSLEVLCLRS